MSRGIRMSLTGLASWMVFGLMLNSLGQAVSSDAAARRMAVLRVAAQGAAARPELVRALEDEDVVVRRTAARCLGNMGAAALPAMQKALANSDALVRRIAAQSLAEAGAAAVEPLTTALKDQDPLVRHAAAGALAAVRPRTAKTLELLIAAQKDESPLVAEVATHAAGAYFTVVQDIPLPLDGWKFKLDADDKGREGKWFRPDLDDSQWASIGIGKFWQDFGHNYEGVAWYRRSFNSPRRTKAQRVELRFGAVDESAWVWLNGEYAGEHDVGLSGWDKPFRLDVTRLLRWGQENQIAVRVHNAKMAGGIWKPITLVASELRE